VIIISLRKSQTDRDGDDEKDDEVADDYEIDDLGNSRK